MIIEALLAAAAVSLISVVGAILFGHNKRLEGVERFVVPVAVGIFLSLALTELIPETIAAEPTYGTYVIALGFISFYVLASLLHNKFHTHSEDVDCHKKNTAYLILIGDAVHNLSDGFILGGAFLIDPAVGVATALGLAMHEVPQEIVEFGVLLRAGYTKKKAALLNLISASSIILGVVIIMAISEHAAEVAWILTAFAAGNLLYLASSELLPRIHGNLSHYRSIWHTVFAIVFGFVLMTAFITWAHEQIGHEGHAHDENMHEEHHEDEHMDEEHHEDEYHPVEGIEIL